MIEKEIRKKYYFVLELVLIENLNLLSFENMISDTLNIYDLKLKETLNFENLKLKYFFVANKLNLQNLNDSELKVLIESKDFYQLKNLILSTLKKVLTDYTLENEALIQYSFDTIDNFKKNGDLVIGYICNPFYIKKSNEEWPEYFSRWENTIEFILKSIKSLGKENLNINVELVEYSLSNARIDV